jgi:hypothetical protein
VTSRPTCTPCTLHALGDQDLDAAIDGPLLELEIGNSVAQQSADAVLLLEQRHVVAGAVELLRGREAGGAGADHRHALAAAALRRLGHDPALGEAALGDRLLDDLDRDRIVVDAEHAGGLAGRRTNSAGELGEVVRAMQAIGASRHFPR